MAAGPAAAQVHLAHGAAAAVQHQHGAFGVLIDRKSAGRPAVCIQRQLIAVGNDPLSDKIEGLVAARLVLGRIQRFEFGVDADQLLQRAVLGQLGGKSGAVHRVERILVPHLGDQQLEKIVLSQLLGGSCVGRLAVGQKVSGIAEAVEQIDGHVRLLSARTTR